MKFILFCKGFAYIQFCKASEACRAYEEMNDRCLNSNYKRHVKVYISPSRSQLSQEVLRKKKFYSRMHRLYVVVEQYYTKNDIIDVFEVSK